MSVNTRKRQILLNSMQSGNDVRMALPQRASDSGKPTRVIVAGNILALMGRYRVSQKALAAHLSISQPALSKRLSAKQAFDLDELELVSQFFGVSVPDLLMDVNISSRWNASAAGQDIIGLPAQDGQMELALDAGERVLVSV